MRSKHHEAPLAGPPAERNRASPRARFAPTFLALAFPGLAFLALAFLALSCGGGIEDADATLATLRPVRGAVAIDGEAVAPVTRVDSTQNIALQTRSLARLELDLGARLLLGDRARLRVRDIGRVQLEGGRVFAEVQGGGPPLEVRTERGRLRLHDGSVSIAIEPDALRAYVVRGELSFSAGGARGVVAAGDELVLDGDGARTAPTTLFDDWTGGLAEPGPVDPTRARGVGALEARVPDEVGRARWPLVVRRMDVRVRIDGDVATTEVEQVFFNPASEALEGLYRVRVPSGAVLQRFAVDREGTLVDGYVRERAQARRAYEAQVYRGSTDDPALLEWDGGDAYRARIYPIGAGETRRIVIRYAEWLRPSADGRRRLYRYPMGGGDRAPRIAELSLRVDVSGAGAARLRAGLGATMEEGRVRLRRSDFVPRADFWLDLIGEAATDAAQPAWRAPHAPSTTETARIETSARVGGAGEAGEADERDYYFLPLVLPSSLAGEDAPEGLDMVVVADISAATDRARLELGRSAVEALTRLLSARDRVAIVGGDLTLRTLSADEGAPALGDTTPRRIEGLLDGLARARAGGATDLGAILSEAAALLDPARRGLVVYVGDGAPTVGERDAAALLDRIARLPHPARFYAIGVGADANLPLLSALTDGGGLALRVEERRQAADAALDLFAHAVRPVAHDVRVSLGDTIANRYPRRPVNAILGDVLPVVGRIDGAPPRFVTVTGTILGEPFSTRIELVTQESAAAVDLRLRWSSARLQHLLHDGATEEEIAELGVRYGMITPYTSYYVPSARELAAASRPPATSTSPAPDDDMPAEEVAADPAPAAQAPIVQPAEAPPPPRSPRPVRVSRQELRAASTGAGASVQAGVVNVRGSRDAGTVAGGTNRAMSAVRACYAAALGRTAGLGGTLTVRFSIGPGGEVQGAALAPSVMFDAAFLGCVTRAFQSLRFPPAEGLTTVTQSISFSSAGAAGGPPLLLMLAQTVPLAIAAATEHARGEAHRPRACSDASGLPLADRRELWRERLQADTARGVRAQALRDCEAPTWRDRSALIDVLVSWAGTVPAMLAVYAQLGSSAERAHARALILRRVRTAQDLRAVRRAFSEADALDWTLVEQILERAPSATHRLRALRRLSAQFPRSFELKLRLLEALEAEARLPEARRLADRMRRDPLADAGVRAAVGEMLLRQGEREEARRALSEIVELAPLDELARRRLGDLYRAHGWFEEAYRQYETLRELRPDDPSVLLLLAQAAGGAGRVDEALRLEASLSQTDAPGSARGLARTARLWSSVRFARLRSATDDPARLARLRRRRARSGVLGSRVALRIALTFAHPDAQLSLFTAHPGGHLARPADLAPEHGIEVFDVEEPEPGGAYRVEVRRFGSLRSSAEAELCVLLDEGGPDEAVILLPLRFRAGEPVLAWTLEDGRLTPLELGPAR